MTPKILKSDSDYEAALGRIDSLMFVAKGTEEAEELELWLLLVEEYGKKHFPIPLPDPIDAILFRMEQQDLKQRDLVPFIGSPGRVSEILHHKRKLTAPMIRKLHEGLGIPLDLLFGKENCVLPAAGEEIDPDLFPVAEMLKRNWFEGFSNAKAAFMDKTEEVFRPFLMAKEGQLKAGACHYRKTKKQSDPNHLWAWKARVWSLVKQQKLGSYRSEFITPDFIREVARLSVLERGPSVARDYLASVGIGLVFERHLPKTYLDGAAIRLKGEPPFIAMTLRHDQLDNFWFTLCHELAHVHLHLQNDESQVFIDDLDDEDRNEKEMAADKLASEAIVSTDEWKDFSTGARISIARISMFAHSIRINPAIIAGRIRRETGDFSKFNSLLGFHQVRRMFGIPS